MQQHTTHAGTLILCTLAFVVMASGAHAKLPLTIAGITLGENIGAYSHLCLSHTAMTLRSERHLTEVNINPAKIPGISNGKIAYANCARPGEIIRIKFKMIDKSLDFFNTLYQHYRKKFGKPTEWRGDPFHNVISWKWAVTDSANRQVNIVLTHLLDEDLQKINAIKITFRSQWEKEAQCNQVEEARRKKTRPRDQEKPHAIDIERFIPR